MMGDKQQPRSLLSDLQNIRFLVKRRTNERIRVVTTVNRGELLTKFLPVVERVPALRPVLYNGDLYKFGSCS